MLQNNAFDQNIYHNEKQIVSQVNQKCNLINILKHVNNKCGNILNVY